MRVYLQLDDIDRHGEECDCGSCDMNGKSYGVGIYELHGSDEVIERVYAGSEGSAIHNAKLTAKESCLQLVGGPEE